MTKGKIIFTGSFGTFFIAALGLTLLSIITLGLLLPYLFYWQFKYFFTHMEIELYTPMTAAQGPAWGPPIGAPAVGQPMGTRAAGPPTGAPARDDARGHVDS